MEKNIQITVAASCKSTDWKREKTTVHELFDKLSRPNVIQMTHADFVALGKTEEGKKQQGKLKDVGGFVGGTFAGRRRLKRDVTGRDIICLDLDEVPAGKTQEVIDKVAAFGVTYCVYSTAKHCPEKPKLRVVLPLEHTCAVAELDEYEAIARKLGEKIGIDWCDASTFEPERMMYWGTCTNDVQYVFSAVENGKYLDGDAILSEYTNWRDATLWAGVDKTAEKDRKAKHLPENPADKRNIVGAFCSVYTISEAIAKFLPDVYEEAKDGRYTHIGSSTAGGAINYGDKYLFSHHGTDVACGMSLNAFDLVRIHLFGKQDENAGNTKDVTKLPSFRAMSELCAKDADVMRANEERKKEDKKDKARARVQSLGNAGESVENSDNYVEVYSMLRLDDKNRVVVSSQNYATVLENDEAVKVGEKYVYDKFLATIVPLGELPYIGKVEDGKWTDTCSFAVKRFIETRYDIRSDRIFPEVFDTVVKAHRIDSLVEAFDALPKWDGVPRLDSVLIDYLGAEDTPYTRAVTMEAFCGAIERVYKPGAKHDEMLVLIGGQGICKSTFLRKISMNEAWFLDGEIPFDDGKKAAELMRGRFIVEVNEMTGYSKADANAAKQFLSAKEDVYRPVYARNSESYPRRCTFWGSTNDDEFLKDLTGNRRFRPVVCRSHATLEEKAHVHNDLPKIVPQLWAEAYAYMESTNWEHFLVSEEIEREAAEVAKRHLQTPETTGMILEFASRPIPEDWWKKNKNGFVWDIKARREFWENYESGLLDKNMKLVERDRICANEIWCELYGKNPGDIKQKDRIAISAALTKLKGFERSDKNIRFGIYGESKGFKRE